MKKPIQFGKYYLLDRINVGGMAEVFKAKAFGVEGFERLLAVKRILPNIAEDEEFITMFIDEAKIAVQLNHANVCQIFDLGKVDDSYFIALEFVHGKDLRAIFDRCRQKPAGLADGQTAMPVAQASFIIMKACEGLDYAHNKRDPQGAEIHLVHRDVSPQNVLISYEGEVKLIDFGIAKAAGKMSQTQQGILKGKFGYMSPEQVRGLPLDRRSDIFSLGIVLYELLTGERLFVGESDFSTLEKVRNVEILPPSTYNRRISDELERIVMKALAKDVEDRYQNAIDLHDDLQAYMYTAGEFYSRKDLAAFMKKMFSSEIEAENAKLETYQNLTAPEMERMQATLAQGRKGSVPPPLPSSAMSSGAGLTDGPPPGLQRGARATQPPAAPLPALATTLGKNGHAGAAGLKAEPQVGGLAWDEEELATNIYDGSEDAADAADAVVEDKPERAGPPPRVPYGTGAPAPRNGTASEQRPMELPPPSFSPGPHSGIDLLGPGISLYPQSQPSRAPLYVGVGMLSVVLCAGVAWLFLSLGGKPGEVVITSDPAVNVQVLVDNKRVPVDGTPATLKLEPGSYVLTVQREGYVPWNEHVEVKAGDTVRKRVVLEPLAAGTGFTLVSDPPGAQVLLDGNTLEGVTPFQVKSVSPGKHTLEVRGQNRAVWTQEIVLEAGKMAEVRANLTAKKAAVGSGAPTARAVPPALTAKEPKEPPKAEPKVARAEPKAPSPSRDLPRPPKSAPVVDDDDDAKPQPKAKAPEKAAGGEGFLRIGSKPWTNIAVDGKELGLHTPQTQIKLGVGSHRITLTNAEFNIKETFSVDIRAGETSTVIKDLRQQGADTD